MTNSIPSTTHTVTSSYSGKQRKSADTAPMVLTRLSGWIDVGENKTTTPNWIVRTTSNQAR